MAIANNFLLGADPELWIYDNKQQKIISADGLFPGTKENPFPVTHGAVQVDGMAAEYNILPARTVGEFVFNNVSVLRDLKSIIQHHNPTLDFDFKFQPVADFGAEYIASQREEAKRLGCTPDYNAWDDGKETPTPDAEMPFRTSSGHIHIGWTKDMDITDPDHIEACCMMVKQLDCQLGLYLPQIEGKDGPRRRELYGKAGAFRPKTYGVEYRTPSDVWLTHTSRMQMIFKRTKQAYEELLGGYQAYNQIPFISMSGSDGKVMSVRDIIDSGDKNDITKYHLGAIEDRYAPAEGGVTIASLDHLYDKWKRYEGQKNDNLLVPAPVRAEFIEGANLPDDRGLFVEGAVGQEPVPFVPDEQWLADFAAAVAPVRRRR